MLLQNLSVRLNHSKLQEGLFPLNPQQCPSAASDLVNNVF